MLNSEAKTNIPNEVSVPDFFNQLMNRKQCCFKFKPPQTTGSYSTFKPRNMLFFYSVMFFQVVKSFEDFANKRK